MKTSILLTLLLLSACAEPGPALQVSDLEVTRPLPGSGMSAGYFRMENTGTSEVVIDRVSSPAFGKVEMHETQLQDGVSRMRSLDAVRLAPGDEIVFERGGKHLMLMRRTGDDHRVDLRFYSGDELLLITSTTMAP